VKLIRVVAAKRAVVFDLFHTLTSVESSSNRTLPSTAELLGVDAAAWNDQMVKKSRERLLGLKTDSFEIIAEMARAIDPSVSDERIRHAVENRLARFRAAVLDIPEATVAVLQELKRRDKRLGLVSNADTGEIAAWGENRICHLFDSTIYSCAVGLAKPDPMIYHQSLKELEIEAGAAVFVGDGASDELQGAKSAGITSVLFTGVIQYLWPERVAERAWQADYVIERLSELVGD
jgi:putative hydrolase of the HAD superfamily